MDEVEDLAKREDPLFIFHPSTPCPAPPVCFAVMQHWGLHSRAATMWRWMDEVEELALSASLLFTLNPLSPHPHFLILPSPPAQHRRLQARWHNVEVDG